MSLLSTIAPALELPLQRVSLCSLFRFLSLYIFSFHRPFSLHAQSPVLTSIWLFSFAEEIEKKLTAYRRGSKFWRMLIFCQVRNDKEMRLVEIESCYVLEETQTQCDESDPLIMQHGEKTSTSVLCWLSGFCCTTHLIILSYLDYHTTARITLRNTENKTRHFKVQKNKTFQHNPRQILKFTLLQCLS